MHTRSLFIRSCYHCHMAGLVVVCLVPTFAVAQQPTAQEGNARHTKDIYAIPATEDANLLLQFADKLLETQSPDPSPEGMIAHATQLADVSIQVADRILKTKEVNDVQAARAAEMKLNAYLTLVELEGPKMQPKLEQQQQAMRKDKRAAVRAIIAMYDSLASLQGWREFDEQQKQQWIKDYLQAMRDTTLQFRHGQVLVTIVSVMDQLGDKQFATRLAEGALPLLAKSKGERVDEVVGRLQGIVRFHKLVGKKIDVEGTTLDQQRFDWSKYRGKVVLLDFWGTWCEKCILELPKMKSTYQQYHGKGFEIVGICLDDSEVKVQQFVERFDVPWTMLFSFDPNATGQDHPLAVKYGIETYPGLILVGKDGKVISTNAHDEVLRQHLKKLLGDATK